MTKTANLGHLSDFAVLGGPLNGKLVMSRSAVLKSARRLSFLCVFAGNRNENAGRQKTGEADVEIVPGKVMVLLIMLLDG